MPIELIDDTPSRKEGMSKDVETRLRVYGCQLIQEAGILMKLYA